MSCVYDLLFASMKIANDVNLICKRKKQKKIFPIESGLAPGMYVYTTSYTSGHPTKFRFFMSRPSNADIFEKKNMNVFPIRECIQFKCISMEDMDLVMLYILSMCYCVTCPNMSTDPGFASYPGGGILGSLRILGQVTRFWQTHNQS